MVQWCGSGLFIAKKIRWDFMARTCALITPIQLVLDRVSCSNETLPNEPKYFETHQNMSLGCNGVDLVRLLRKIPMRLRVTNFCINCTSSPRFALNFLQLRNDPKSQMHPNTMKRTKTWVLDPMGWIGCVRCNKFWHNFMARNFALIAPVQPI